MPLYQDTVYFTSDQLSALLRWCQAIGAFYNLSIDNFTTSFADGRGFGALLSYYHPTLLDMTEMKDSARFLSEYKQVSINFVLFFYDLLWASQSHLCFDI